MTLRSRHDVVKTIAGAAGLPDLMPDAEGIFELVIEDRLSVFFRIDDDQVLELAAEVPQLSHNEDPTVLRAMLAVNLDSAEGHLFRQPQSGQVYFGSRLLISELDARRLLARIDAFIRAAAPWSAGTAAETLLAGVREGSRPTGVPDVTGLRA